MTEDHDFPVDLPADPDDGAGALRWTAMVLMAMTLALALLNADAITSWSHDLPASDGTAKVMAAADGWRDTTVRFGLDRPHATLHQAWKRAQASRWPGTTATPPL